jgi:hypothetical protein
MNHLYTECSSTPSKPANPLLPAIMHYFNLESDTPAKARSIVELAETAKKRKNGIDKIAV